MMRILTPLLLSALLTTACGASETEIRAALESRYSGLSVATINKTPVAGIYEVYLTNGEIVYSDEEGNYILAGDLIETKTRKSLTKERLDKLQEISFDSLPLDQAIKVVRGDGKRRLAVFSDPDCPYCRKLEPELAKLDNITIYTFAYPLPMHKDAMRKSKLVLCSPDPAKAWRDLLIDGKVPEGKDDCGKSPEAILALGNKLHIQGTPAMIFVNGKRAPGFMPADKIESLLAGAEGGK